MINLDHIATFSKPYGNWLMEKKEIREEVDSVCRILESFSKRVDELLKLDRDMNHQISSVLEQISWESQVMSNTIKQIADFYGV